MHHDFMDIDIRDFRMVAAIAVSGSVTRAAGELHLTQSAVSHQLRAIEDGSGRRSSSAWESAWW